MDRFGGWVLTRACEDAVRWLRDHPATPVELSVNVSSAELMAPGFVGDVAAVLAATGLPPGALVLELTEGTLIEDSELSLRVLGDLRAIGVAVALDDFGTGYASLSFLRRLPIDIVKIDPSFVADIERVTRGGAIVAAMSDVAHALELRVVAEGVETTTQQAVLAAAGVDCAQGFLYARPMPPAEVDALLATTTDFAVRLG
jgi:EAL domain-containing protein (putative c-di-GMP-specific phosphodiesterase class I)